MPGHVEIHGQRLAQALQLGAARWGEKFGRQVENAAKERCPVDEGRLRSSITHTVTVSPGKVTVRVGSPLEYAVYVHEGTGIYGPRHAPIRPVSKKALKFPTPKQMGPLAPGARRPSKDQRGFVFATEVKGSPPNPFLADALETVAGRGQITRRSS